MPPRPRRAREPQPQPGKRMPWRPLYRLMPQRPFPISRPHHRHNGGRRCPSKRDRQALLKFVTPALHILICTSGAAFATPDGVLQLQLD